MKIIEKILRKREEEMSKTPTVAFFGDSVTEGCFELYMKSESLLGNVCEPEFSYGVCLEKMISLVYPDVSMKFVNAGLAGDNAKESLKRLDKDVLTQLPDLTVVCFGLNDSYFGLDYLESYLTSLSEIFDQLSGAGSEIIFMTPNMMNTYVSERVEPPMAKGNARGTEKVQTSGIYDRFLEEARNLCNKRKIPVCDCYRKWKRLYENGVDTTELLANKINHPVREMHWLFAGMLLDTMLENC